MRKALPLLALMTVLMTPQAFAAQQQSLGNFYSQFAQVCAMQMAQQAEPNGVSLPTSVIQGYCNCTANDLVSSAQTNPVLMKLLSDPNTPTQYLENYFKHSANKCSSQYFSP